MDHLADIGLQLLRDVAFTHNDLACIILGRVIMYSETVRMIVTLRLSQCKSRQAYLPKRIAIGLSA